MDLHWWLASHTGFSNRHNDISDTKSSAAADGGMAKTLVTCFARYLYDSADIYFFFQCSGREEAVETGSFI